MNYMLVSNIKHNILYFKHNCDLHAFYSLLDGNVRFVKYKHLNEACRNDYNILLTGRTVLISSHTET